MLSTKINSSAHVHAYYFRRHIKLTSTPTLPLVDDDDCIFNNLSNCSIVAPANTIASNGVMPRGVCSLELQPFSINDIKISTFLWLHDCQHCFCNVSEDNCVKYWISFLGKLNRFSLRKRDSFYASKWVLIHTTIRKTTIITSGYIIMSKG